MSFMFNNCMIMKEQKLNKRECVVEITSALYQEAANYLAEAIGEEEYFSGKVEFNSENVECRLTISVIVYRNRVSGEINDLVPVWWEFDTLVDGEERLNDFSFRYLRALFLD